MSAEYTEECCREFHPEPWDEKEVVWENKLFVRDTVKTVFRIPINFGSVMKRNMELIAAAGAMSPETIVLSDENSLWGSDVYISVTGDVPGAEMGSISGRFLSKVFEGPYKDMHKWISDMNEYVEGAGETIKKMYFYYTTCPKCAKKYGKNYVVLLAEIPA